MEFVDMHQGGTGFTRRQFMAAASATFLGAAAAGFRRNGRTKLQ
jgi:hypothetical protein